MWVELAKCVNLHPDYRRSLPQWLEKIDRFLEGGRSFKLEDYSADNYPLLPSLWHAMEPNHKRLVFDLVGRNGDSNPKCLHELHTEASLLSPDMHIL